MIQLLLNLQACLDKSITMYGNGGGKTFTSAKLVYQCCLLCGWDVKLERITGNEKDFPEFRLCEPCGLESEARRKGIKDSRDRFQRWWWRDVDSLTFGPTRLQGFRELKPKSRSVIKRRAHYSFRIRLINRRGCFRIALWFLSPERVCLSSSITFPYLSGLDFYLQWAHFLFYSQTYSSVRCTAWTRRLKWKVAIGCKLSQQPHCCSNKQAFQLIGIDHWMSEKCSQ